MISVKHVSDEVSELNFDFLDALFKNKYKLAKLLSLHLLLINDETDKNDL